MAKRRITAMVGALFLILTIAVPAQAGPIDPNGTFTDDDGSVHEPSIEAIAEVGVAKGCNPPTNDLYCPDLGVTRAQVASFLIRALSLDGPIPVGPDAFADDNDSVHAGDIDKLASLGIARGCDPPTNSLFCPDDTVSRGQMAAFLTRAFGYVDDDPATDRFADDDGSVFEGDIEALAAAGVTVGCNPPTNDRFCPDNPVTRAEMATFLMRALGLDPLAPPEVGVAELVRPVFLLDQPSGGPFLATLARYVESGQAGAERAVIELLEGLETEELSQIPAFSTAVPDGTELLGIDVTGGTATVDLTGEFDDGGGSATMFARLAQLTFTLVQYEMIDSVMLELDGVPVTVFSSEGIDISGGLDVAYFNDLGVIPEKFPVSPAAFEFVESPFNVEG
ncbi:MAG: GerMN domain-containing protein, partial [Acidimicrobiia bacterium]|nr:GerMN domain-containing protein [Acidimicrobiia bacterium]